MLPWRTDADGFIFSNSWDIDPTERAQLASAVTPISLGVAPALLAMFPPLAFDPIAMTTITAAAAAAAGIASLTAPINYGLCGGMAYTSCDYWLARAPLPGGSFEGDQPADTGPVPSAIRGLIWSRLLDSLTGGGAFQNTVVWSLILDPRLAPITGGAGKLNQMTQAEWIKVKATIDAGRPCPIGLVYTTRDIWNQHQILVYGYDDFGTNGRLYVYDSNNPHAFGASGITVGDDIVTFDFSGSALKATSPGDAHGGTLAGFFATNYAPKTPPSSLASAYGQFLAWDDDSRFWTNNYGALLPIADTTELGALGASGANVCMTHTTVPNPLPRPRDNALFREHSAAPVFIYEGGCPFHVPDPATLNLFGGWGAVRLAPDNTLSRFIGPPDNGTLLRERSSAHVFQITNGAPTLSATPVTNASVRVLFDGALDSLLLANITFSAPAVTVGGSVTGTVHLKAPMPERDVVAMLASGQPGYVSVPASVTIPKNTTSASFTVTAKNVAFAGSVLSVPITATLGETMVSAQIGVQLPRLASFTVSPTPVVAGQTATATLTLQAPYAGSITVALRSYGPAFATVPPSVSIPPNTTSVQFLVTAVPSVLPFSPAKVDINASYADVSADCIVIVDPSVVAGTVKSLTLTPNPVTSGGSTRATVTLSAAVKTPTTVGLTSQGMVGMIGQTSSIISSMPSSVTVQPGSTQATFTITVKPITAQATQRSARIIAIAVDEATATLSVS
jgi:hypothetical protein